MPNIVEYNFIYAFCPLLGSGCQWIWSCVHDVNMGECQKVFCVFFLVCLLLMSLQTTTKQFFRYCTYQPLFEIAEKCTRYLFKSRVLNFRFNYMLRLPNLMILGLHAFTNPLVIDAKVVSKTPHQRDYLPLLLVLLYNFAF